MNNYTEQLKNLRAQIHEKERIEAILRDLWEQHSLLAKKSEELKEIAKREQSDVERLEGFTFASFFAKIRGDLDERLTKEQQESYAAAVKYKMALDEIGKIENDIFGYNKKLQEYRKCRQEYDKLFSEKHAAIKQTDLPEALEIIRAEKESFEYELQLREIAEAIGAGKNALDICDNISKLLDSAEGWGTYDLIAGDTISSLVKHSKLDSAQENIGHLQSALRRFRSELADIDVQTEIRVDIDGFLRFADVFFDCFVADYTVLKRIQNSKGKIREVKTKISSVVRRLEGLKSDIEKKLSRNKGKIRSLVDKTDI